ncbi:gp73 [Bacillus phage W.Ph.]|uniref:Gp73 n=1 Tax=Bacillus phage W.Ph. TaxID=764595 RepID=G9B1H4_9CAUD|nr:gp73 [Bacillus phage W.Ph.]ADH03219.1 gp73 [Bacillus phage W.Ph.]
MKCNNKYCCFQAFDSCCHESEEGFDNATPNQLDCPSSVRVDLENELYEYEEYIMERYDELIPAYKLELTLFTMKQRMNDKQVDELLRLFSERTNMKISIQMRTLSELVEVKKYISKLERECECYGH